jgi:hypothetical protein
MFYLEITDGETTQQIGDFENEREALEEYIDLKESDFFENDEQVFIIELNKRNLTELDRLKKIGEAITKAYRERNYIRVSYLKNKFDINTSVYEC